MGELKTKTNDRPITNLMNDISKGKIQLPDFQRGWVWDDYNIRALIASITNFFPIGVAMFLEYGNPAVRFQYRMVEGAKNFDFQPDELILDGQQRLTTMYLAMYCDKPVKTQNDKGTAIERYYYIDMEKALDANCDRIDAIISMPKERVITKNFGKEIVLSLTSDEQEYKNKMFPLNIIFNSSKMLTWQMNYTNFYSGNFAAQQLYIKFYNEIIGNLMNYHLPVTVLEKETSKEAVCQVFEKVNTGGIKLTAFELVTATFAMDNFNLRKDWQRRAKIFSATDILREVTATDFLVACALLSSYNKGGTVSCRKKDVLNLQLEDYKYFSNVLAYGFIYAEKFLNEEKVFSSRDLPYTTQLIPLSVLCAILNNKNLLTNAEVKNKLRQWYWCGVFGELYGTANETRYANDVVGVMNWINGGNLPKTVVDFNFAPMRLASLQTRNSAAYKGFMALILKNSAKDFVSGNNIDFISYKAENVDVCYIFPQSYCEKNGFDKRKWNSIINKTPLAYKTGLKLGGTAPSKYLKAFRTKISFDDLRNFLQTHWIDYEDLADNDFDHFIFNRAHYLLNAVEVATGKKISGRASAEVKNFFGGEI